ncbi:protein Wiz isoform X2 [Bombina bombina]|uniref:protein Wiz isoform X2 n=1 Tax=Bombina bombina TaxID=8345 RepID=UPI00235AD2F4|nr:protein Wiz isoform X2 [Bombina bombina]XP_053573922.1 protein Wiz isoform X2 [Bombina bombina]
MEEEAAHTSYIGGREDVEGLPYQLSSLSHGEACAPISCPGGVEIVLVGEGVSRERTFQENSVITSLSRMGPRDESRQDMRLSIPEESEGIACGSIMERQEEENLIPALATPKFTLPPPVHRLNPHTPPTFNSAWNFQSSESQEDNSGVGAGGVSSEGQYLHDRRYEWTVGLEEAEDQSRLMSVPPSISLPVYRRALDFGKGQGPWQGGNYSEEDAQVEVEEDDGEEEEGSVYTCIECSIYFKKKAHLLEHMFQHSQEGESEGTQICEGPHTCGECGKGFVDEESLVLHGRLHQESRQKIIEEIRKLENLTDEGRSARLQCPKCLFGTNSSKVFVQHAKTHVKKGAGDSRGSIKSFQETPEIAESSVVSKQDNDRKRKSTEIGGLNEQRWRVEVPQETVNRAEQSLGKSKRKASPRQNMESFSQDELGLDAQHPRSERSPCIPQTAVQLKWRFRELLKTVEWDEEGQKRQLREEVAIVVLGKIGLTKKKPKGPLSSYRKKLRDEKGNGKTLPSKTSSIDIELPQDVWEEDDDNDDLPLDMLLMDPNYEKQLEALGLRSEERECPYCPDRFHNGIGLANHVRGHLNRVGVSYNVRHFISAEEVKAIEQNYSFQKKRKKVANFDPSTFSLMRCEFCGAGFDTRAGLSSHARAHLRDFGITNWELTVSPIHVLTRLLARSPGRPLPPFPPWHQDADADVIGSEEEDRTPLDLWRSQISKQEPGQVEKMASEQSTGRNDDSKGPGQTTCDVCGAGFETRKGLSSHARSHLRHLGVAESESSGAPIDLLYELAKQGKLPQEESMLGAKKSGSPQPGSPKAQWVDEDGPLNLTMEGESGRDTDCQFCGAWFETRKGLSSHSRAHLRQLGVVDPDAKGSPIAALNALIKTEEFKKRLASGHVPGEAGTHTKSSDHNTSTNRNSSASSKLSDSGTFARAAEGTAKANDGASSKISEGGVRFYDRNLSSQNSIHFKSPSGSGTNSHTKLESPRGLSHAGGSHSKLAISGNARVKSEAGNSHSKMAAMGTHPKASPTGFTHHRPSPTSTPPAKKLKASKASMDYWSSSNSSTPLNLSPSSEEVRCEFCGEFFENRKGLSSHARSHLRQMGVTEWHVNGSPIDTLREIVASGTCPRPGNRIAGPSSEKIHPPPSSPSGSGSYSRLSPALQNKPPRLPSYPAGEWPSDLSPLNLSSRADPTRDIRCEFCNEFFENRKGLSSHARSHLRQMGVTEWHVNGSPIDTLRDIIRKKRPPPPQLTNIKKEPRGDRNPTSPSPTNSTISMGHSGVNRESPISPLGGRPHNNFLPPLSPKRPAPHEPRMSQSEPKSYFHLEPKSCSQSQTKTFMQGENRPKAFMHDDGRPRSYTQGDGRPKTFLQGEGKPKTFSQGENKLKPFSQGEVKPKVYTQGEGKLKTFHQDEIKPKVYSQGEGKPKAYIQTELPFKVKVKTSPEKTTTLEACCELCGLYFENRKALASHSRAHLRQFGVTEWCVNGSPIETLREWMKQRPQKAGAYLSYIQSGRPFSKKFKRSSHTPKQGAAEKESQATASGKTEADWTPGVAIEKSAEGQGQKTERRHPKPPEVPPSREDGALEHTQKTEEQRQLQRARPVPSLVPRPPATSLVKFVGNIYTLKCRFCDIQFQGPLSIQEQWVRHLQHHILEMNYSKPPSPPVQSSPSQPEPAKAL